MNSIKSIFFNLAFIGISGAFLYIGFQSAHVELHRNDSGTVDGRISSGLFQGIYHSHETINDIKGTKLDSRNVYSGPRTTTRHAVLVFSERESVPIFRYNDFGYATLEKINNEINTFLSNPSKMTFDERYNMNNAAGIFGVIFLLLWILTVFRVFR